MNDLSTIEIQFPMKTIPHYELSVGTKEKPSCEYAKWKCIEHLKKLEVLRETLTLPAQDYTEDELINFFLASGLLKSKNNGYKNDVWLPPSFCFEKTSKKQVYQFRIRHRPPAKCFVENTLLTEFFVLQAVGDVISCSQLVNSNAADDMKQNRMPFALTTLALLFPSNLPLKNSYTIGEKHKITKFRFHNYHKRLSREVYGQLNTSKNIFNRLLDHYVIYQEFNRDFNKFKKEKNQLKDCKEIFLNTLLTSYPSYCFESYAVGEPGTEKAFQTVLNIFGESSEQQPGIYFDENRVCGLEDLGRVRVNTYDGAKWSVELEGKNDPMSDNKILLFQDEEMAKSFVSMLQGYATLCIRPDINLCPDLTSFSVKIRDELKSFCPLYHDKAVEYLINENQQKLPMEHCKFLIYQSKERLYEFHVATEDPEPVGHIQWENGKWRLWCKSKNYSTPFEKVLHIKQELFGKYGQQLNAKRVSVLQSIDPRSIFHLNKSAAQSIEPDFVTYEHEPSAYIMVEDLLHQWWIEGNWGYLKRSVVKTTEEDKRVKVELTQKKMSLVEAFHKSVTTIAKLSRLHREVILHFYGPVIAPTTRLSFLFEHTPYNDLVSFLALNKTDTTTLCRMKLAQQVVAIFCTLALPKESSSNSTPLLHGNLRGHNFWVFLWNGKIYLKLGDPGMVHHYNTLSLKLPENDMRLPWLSPERRASLGTVTVASECYAVATTIAEIFHGHDNFRSIMHLDPEQKLDTVIPMPLFPTAEDAAVMPSVVDLIDSLWGTLRTCWDKDHQNRLSPQELKDAFIELEGKASGIPVETVFDHFKAKYSNECVVNGPKSMAEFHRILQDKKKYYIEPKYLTISDVLLGQGHYGFVHKGQLEKDGEIVNVAVKIKDLAVDEVDKEIDNCAALNHRNIVKFLHHTVCVYQRKSKSCIIMELMNMGNLCKFASKISWNDATESKRKEYTNCILTIALDIAKGMAHMEEMKIFHCDLAARNVLLDNQLGTLTAKVSDFGLALVVDKDKDYYYQEKLKDKSKPIFWYPPEYLIYERNCEESSGITYTSAGDVWAYGVTLWEAFSKQTPYSVWTKSGRRNVDEHSLYNYYMNHKSRWPRPEHMGISIYEDFCMKCWKEDDRDRPSFQELRTQLSELLENNIPN